MSDRLTSQRRIFDTLLPVAEQRVRERELQLLGQKVPQHADCISWIIETAPKQNPWTGKRVVHELMAIWFGSVHAVSTVRKPMKRAEKAYTDTLPDGHVRRTRPMPAPIVRGADSRGTRERAVQGV
jgi:hypothetical protein